MGIKQLNKICRMSQHQLLSYCYNRLKTVGYKKVIRTKRYVIAIGENPIALVAHLDTVHIRPPYIINYDPETECISSPTGIGADDRAGVYAIFQLLETKPTVIFCTDEECGALGAQALIKDMPTCPVDLKYIIELDRQGVMECVFYDCDNPEFEKYIEGFNFKSNWGSFSDISWIAPEWKVAAVNLSVGYKYQHTTKEILSLPALQLTIDTVKQMLKSPPEEKFIYVEKVYAYTTYAGAGWDKYMELKYGKWEQNDDTPNYYNLKNYPGYGYGEYSELRKAEDNEIVCASCRCIEPMNTINIHTGLCDWCDDNQVMCDGCGEYVYKTDIKSGFCPDCYAYEFSKATDCHGREYHLVKGGV